MGSLSRLWIAGGLAAAVVAGALLLVGHTASPRSATPASPLAVSASFAPPAAQFGDRLTAKVVVLLDRSAVDPDSLHLTQSLAPLSTLGRTRVSRTTRGRLVVVSYESPVACLSESCIADKGARRVKLGRVAAVAERRGGGALRAGIAWPVLPIAGRVVPADLTAATPPFRTDTAPPPAEYRIAPSTLALLLDVLAVASALAGVALATLAVVRVVRTGAPVAADGALGRALRLAREAETRVPQDRRRAVGLVARLLGERELGERDRGLASAASDLAWSRPKPERGAVSELVDEVERTVHE
jgi:hypothetical protein